MKQKKNNTQHNIIEHDLAYFAQHSITTVCALLKSSSEGLTKKDAAQRLNIYGKNEIATNGESSFVRDFISHALTPMNTILFGIVVVSLYLGEHMNAVIVSIMIGASVLIDFFEERSANHAAEKLKEKVTIRTMVLRSGEECACESALLVPGDVIVLNAGDMIPADARIIESADLFVNESTLTGESFPQEKKNNVVTCNGAILTDMDNMLFMGTHVLSGYAKAMIVKTGAKAVFGAIAHKVTHEQVASDFEIGVRNFGFFIMKVVMILVTLVFVFNTILGRNMIESLLFSVAIAIGLTPEFLPMVMSITMARSSVRMAKNGVIVKKLTAIPNLGSMNILCTDKTGTLTEDHITLIEHTDIFGKEDERTLRYAYLNSYFQTGVENAMNRAVIAFRDMDIRAYKKIDELPFDFVRRTASVIVSSAAEGHMLITKGAPESIVEQCDSVYIKQEGVVFTQEMRERAFGYYHEMSAQGYRVVAIAVKRVDEGGSERYKEEKLTLIGFVSFFDPPKKDISSVLQELAELGVETKVITGDNALVAQKICHDVQLPVVGVMQGAEMDHLSDEELTHRVLCTTIFARFSPAHKERIIRVLRSSGAVVGYMGDGINDAPSITMADVGVSVENAVDIAKESADIVLTQKNLGVLVRGIIDGRASFGNTMKYIMMGLSSNFGNMFSVAAAVVFLPFLPMLPTQILLNNFLYDLSQMGLPLDHVDREWIDRPRRWDIRFVRSFMIVFGLVSSIFDLLTFYVLHAVYHFPAATFQTAWFLISITTQILIIHVIRTKRVPFFGSVASTALYITTFFCIAIAWLIPYTVIGSYFHFVTLPLSVVRVMLVIVILYLVTVEGVKMVFYRIQASRRSVVIDQKDGSRYSVSI